MQQRSRCSATFAILALLISALVLVSGSILPFVLSVVFGNRSNEGDVVPADSTVSEPSTATESEPVSFNERSIRKTVDGWLAEQQRGNGGNWYWKDRDTFWMQRFFSVRSWTFVEIITDVRSAHLPDNVAKARVRIDMSNKDGVQITTTWTFLLVPVDDEWKIIGMNRMQITTTCNLAPVDDEWKITSMNRRG